jgi:hypothetical protein
LHRLMAKSFSKIKIWLLLSWIFIVHLHACKSEWKLSFHILKIRFR